MPSLATLHRHIRTIGVLALLVCAVTWALDLTGLVYACPFCRAQRSVIGLLGLLLLWPDPRGWAIRWLASALGMFGAVVAATQHFAGWRRISAGDFRFASAWWVDPFLLSGAALLAIVGLVLLLWSWRPAPPAAR